jgi:hypothetical protein
MIIAGRLIRSVCAGDHLQRVCGQGRQVDDLTMFYVNPPDNTHVPDWATKPPILPRVAQVVARGAVC